MERLEDKEIKSIIAEMKANGKYKEFNDMLLDDFEEHHIIYKLDADEIIAMAYKNNTIPFKMVDFYDWQQMVYLIEEDEGIGGM